MTDIRCQSVEVRKIRNIIVLMRLGFFLLVVVVLSIFIEKGSILCFTCYILSLTIQYMPLVGSQDLRVVLVGLLIVLFGFQYLNKHLSIGTYVIASFNL
jgi:hypothetical protein